MPGRKSRKSQREFREDAKVCNTISREITNLGYRLDICGKFLYTIGAYLPIGRFEPKAPGGGGKTGNEPSTPPPRRRRKEKRNTMICAFTMETIWD